MKKKTSKQILTYLSATGLPPQDCRSVHNQMLKADPPYIRCHSDTTKHEKTKILQQRNDCTLKRNLL